MKNSKLKNLHSKFEISKSNSELEILNSELDKVRGGRIAAEENNTGCGATLNYKCGALSSNKPLKL